MQHFEATFYAFSVITTQLISKLKQLITGSMVKDIRPEDIKPILQVMLNNYVAKINSKNNSEKATLNQLLFIKL